MSTSRVPHIAVRWRHNGESFTARPANHATEFTFWREGEQPWRSLPAAEFWAGVRGGGMTRHGAKVADTGANVGEITQNMGRGKCYNGGGTFSAEPNSGWCPNPAPSKSTVGGGEMLKSNLPTNPDSLTSKRKSLPVALLRRIWQMPCAVCGGTYNICADHIVPVAKGGTNDEANIQPLCWQCNHIKHAHILTNDEVRAVVRERGVDHFLRAEWTCRYHGINPFEIPENFESFKRRRLREGFAL